MPHRGDAPPAVMVATAVRPESRALLAALTAVERQRGAVRPTWWGRAGEIAVAVVEVGIGPAGVAAARGALPPAPIVISAGFAGACRDGLAPGTLLLPERVCWEEAGVAADAACDPGLLAALAAAAARAGVATAPGALFSSAAVLRLPEDKRAAAARRAATAVEMEARALLAHAAASGAAFLPLRVVLDPVDLSLADLPPGIDRLGPRIRAATSPGLWPLLAALRRHAVTAAATLTAVARGLLPGLGRLAPPGSPPYIPRLTDR